MKKLMLFVLIAMLASSLVAAKLPDKLIRLEVINKSGDTVYIKLEGTLFEQFYYLTIPDGEDMTFTVVGDHYKRTTWACGGVKSSGSLELISQVRLTFTPCNRFNWKWVNVDPITGVWYFNSKGYGEPTQEKVTYFKYLLTSFDVPWFIWNWQCFGWYTWETKTYKSPVGCMFRYKY
jgi:hypothetical protein